MGRLADGVVCNQCDYLLIEAEDKLEKHQDFRHGDAHVLQSARASLPRLATITICYAAVLQGPTRGPTQGCWHGGAGTGCWRVGVLTGGSNEARKRGRCGQPRQCRSDVFGTLPGRRAEPPRAARRSRRQIPAQVPQKFVEESSPANSVKGQSLRSTSAIISSLLRLWRRAKAKVSTRSVMPDYAAWIAPAPTRLAPLARTKRTLVRQAEPQAGEGD